MRTADAQQDDDVAVDASAAPAPTSAAPSVDTRETHQPMAADESLPATSATADQDEPQSSLVASDAARIGDLSLQELLNLDVTQILNAPVVTATGSEEGKATAPANVVSFSRAEIRARGWLSLIDILANTPGLYLINDLVMPALGVRGVSGGLRAGTRIVKIMIDGVAVSFRPDLNAPIGPEFIPIEVVERVEIALGPLSALYGANAFLATVNVVTQTPDDRSGGVSMRARVVRANSGGGVSAYASVGDKAKGLLIAFSADRFDRTGLELTKTFDAQDATLARYAPLFAGKSQGDFSRPMGAYVKSFAEVPVVGELSLQGGFQRTDNYSEFGNNSVLTHRSRVVIENWWSDLQWKRGFADFMSASASIGWSWGHPTEEARDYLTRSLLAYYEPRFRYQSLNGDVHLDASPFDRFTLRVGVDGERDVERILFYRQVFLQPQGTTAAGDWVDLIRANANHKEVITDRGVYGQVSYAPLATTAGFRLVANARVDRLSYGDTVFPWLTSWRLAAVNQWTDTVSTKLIVGEAFQAPSGVLMFAQPGFGFGNRLVGNTTLLDVGVKQLREQSVRSYEAVVAAGLFEQLAIQGSVYFQQLHNKIEFIQSATDFVATNRGDTDQIGGDVMVRWTGWISPYTTVSIVERVGSDSETTAISDDAGGLPFYPTRQAALGLDVNKSEWWVFANVQARWVSERRASQSNVLLNNNEIYELPSYWTLDASLSTSGLHPFSSESDTYLRLVARNLFDKRFSEPGYAGFDNPDVGRTVFFEVSQAL